MPHCLRQILFKCFRYTVCVGIPPGSKNEDTIVTGSTVPSQNDEIQKLISETRSKYKKDKIAAEWLVLAKIIDRIMFVLFTLATGIFAAIFLNAVFGRDLEINEDSLFSLNNPIV